jgi:hypothetical protein
MNSGSVKSSSPLYLKAEHPRARDVGSDAAEGRLFDKRGVELYSRPHEALIWALA